MNDEITRLKRELLCAEVHIKSLEGDLERAYAQIAKLKKGAHSVLLDEANRRAREAEDRASRLMWPDTTGR